MLLSKRGGKADRHLSDLLVVEDAQAIAALDTNNSMALADKAYDPPEKPEEIEAYKYDLGFAARAYRETMRPLRRNYVTLFFRVRRKYCEQLLWQLLTTGVITKEKMYMPECLPYWTIGVKMRVRDNFPMGKVMDCVKQRLGITSPGLRFCLDGFFGMTNYSDVFGNIADACPWMEVSNNSTVTSLRLQDGDSLFVNVASSGQIQNVAAWRKRHEAEAALARKRAASMAARNEEAPVVAVEESESEELQAVG